MRYMIESGWYLVSVAMLAILLLAALMAGTELWGPLCDISQNVT